jgi:hypothetical protein
MGRGTWIVQRRLLGIEVRRATGCTERADAHAVEEALLRLAKHGRRDLIEAFARRQITGPELVAGLERYGVTFQFTVESSIRLRRAMDGWLRGADLAVKTRTEYRYNLGLLVGKLPPLTRPPTATERRTLDRGPELRELPALLARYARRTTTRPVMFVQVKAAAQSFARDTVDQGRHSVLWRALAGIQGPKRLARQVQGGLHPARAREVAEGLGRLGPMWWTLCCTGMGRKEYWRTAWEVLADRILVHGTKREHRERVIPRLTTPVRPLVSEKRFAGQLAAVGRDLGIPRLTPYVARRTFAHFLELAKILDSRCDLYMGHSPKSDRAKYREHDVVPYLPADTAALKAVIGPEPRYLEVMA